MDTRDMPRMEELRQNAEEHHYLNTGNDTPFGTVRMEKDVKILRVFPEMCSADGIYVEISENYRNGCFVYETWLCSYGGFFRILADIRDQSVACSLEDLATLFALEEWNVITGLLDRFKTMNADPVLFFTSV